LKSRTGKDQSVQTVTCAICGASETLTSEKIVLTERSALTAKYGSSSVAAGAVPISQVSSLFVVRGAVAAPPTPGENVAFGEVTSRPCAKSEPVRRRVTAIARTKALFIPYLLHMFSSGIGTTSSHLSSAI
jgi:hypothetical protein